MHLIKEHILDLFQMLRLFQNWVKGMDINSQGETSCATQYQEDLLKYAENEYCAKHRRVPVNKLECVLRSNLLPSTTASESSQSSFNPYDLSSVDEEYLTSNNVSQTTPGGSDRDAPWWTTARLYSNSRPEAPTNLGQMNPNLNDYHSNRIEISSTFWILDITSWWSQQGETHSAYAYLSNMVGNIISIIAYGVGVEHRNSLGRDVIGGRQSKTTDETLREKVILWHFVPAPNEILPHADPELDTRNTENDSEMKKEVVES